MTALRRLGSLVRHALIFELNIYKSLLRWVLRRPSVPAGSQPFGYARLVTPVLWLWIFGSAAELPLVHVLVPWPGPRIALLILGVWGLLWMVGFLAGLRSYPHLLGTDVLRIRNGPMHDIVVPRAAIAAVTAQDRTLPSSMWTLQEVRTEHGARLDVAVSGRVNVLLAFDEPLTVHTSKGEKVVTGIGFWADEPREVVAQLRRRDPGPPPRPAARRAPFRS